GRPIGGRLRTGDGGQGGAHSISIRRARASGHPRGRSAATGHAGDTHDQGCLRASRQGNGNDMGTVAGVSRQKDSPATADDAQGDDQRGSLYGLRSSERNDWNHCQLDSGEPRRLVSRPPHWALLFLGVASLLILTMNRLGRTGAISSYFRKEAGKCNTK